MLTPIHNPLVCSPVQLRDCESIIKILEMEIASKAPAIEVGGCAFITTGVCLYCVWAFIIIERCCSGYKYCRLPNSLK